MKKLMYVGIAIFAFSCTKQVLPSEIKISTRTYFTYPGGPLAPQAVSEYYLNGDSVTMEFNGKMYTTSIAPVVGLIDTSVHILSAKSIHGVKLVW